ncbi:MAG: hypothetical protein QNJ82_00135 [Gammaproteobacteria bacterium]|nr:hypothetical protein [Gammaproteobacteria bacterium]
MEPRDGDQLPFSGLAIILLVLSVVFLQKPALKGARPETPSAGMQAVSDPKEVPARLWEDPLSAVRKYQSGARPGITEFASFTRSQGDRIPLAVPSALKDLAKAIRNRERGRLTVLGVSIVGGLYVEDHESRLRTRYAVLSALGIVGYTPERATHISFVESPQVQPGQPPARPAQGGPWAPESPLRLTTISARSTAQATTVRPRAGPHLPLPYEWLRHKNGDDRVLLLWIQEEFLRYRPLAALAALISELRPNPGAESQGRHRTVGVPTPVEFKMLGPAESGTLMQMLEEANGIQRGSDGRIFPELQGVNIYSPSATASEFLLKSRTDFSTHDLREAIWPNPGDGNFIRSIPTDLKLADLIIRELDARDVNVVCRRLEQAVRQPGSADSNSLCADHPDHIVLISEWDTAYGRAMPDAFENALRLDHGSDDLRNAFDLPWVHRFTYLRGIDGRLSGNREGAQRSPDKDRKKDTNNSPMERPIGYGQADYLRRLAVKIKDLELKLRREKGGGIAAIGILGSDVYDKLLILQALRPEFSNTLFFSTDLDARLLEPEQIPWTRNLLVASGFGLELAPELQQTVLPFRGNYQTARFFSTLLALKDHEWAASPVLKDCLCLRPRLFEIGRDRAYDITPLLDGDGRKEFPGSDECNAQLHPETHPVQWSPKFVLLAAGVLASGILLGYHYIFRFREKWRFYQDNAYWQVRGTIVGVQALYILAIVAILLFGITAHHVLGEPFTFRGGISIWPTEALRLLAGLLAVHFAVEAWRIVRQSDREIEKEFFLSASTGSSTSDQTGDEAKTSPWKRLATRLAGLVQFYRHQSIFRWRQLREDFVTKADSNDARTVDLQALWSAYRRLGSLKSRLVRMLPWALVLFFLNFCLIYLLGEPFTPARVASNYALDKVIIIFLAVIPFIVLLLGIFDATRLCIELSNWFVEVRMRWPERTRTVWKQRLGLEADDLREWLGIEFIARRTEAIGGLIYFPFIVIFVLIISRSTYFDRWNMPTGLAIVIAASALYAVVAALTLRRSAEHARGEALRSISDRITKAAGTDNEGRVRQLELLKERIAENRRGAFRPWRQQPVMKVLFWFIGGASLAGLEVLAFWR